MGTRPSGETVRRHLLSMTFILTLGLACLPIGAVSTAAAGDALSVSVTTLPGPTSAPNDLLVVQVNVALDGQALPGAQVSFSDSFASSFTPSTVSTGTDGETLTQLYLSTGSCGTDEINATAGRTGYASASGLENLTVACPISTQLSVTAQVQNNQPTGGSSNVIFGSAFQCCRAAIAGVTIRLADTIGSRFSTESAQTDDSGSYFVNFTLGAPVRPTSDLITVTASEPGYTGSSSTILLVVSPSNSSTLAVKLDRFLPVSISTIENQPMIWSAQNDFMVVVARVTAGGRPVPQASVLFYDQFASSFTPTVLTTNSSGDAVTQLTVSTSNTGMDVISARASLVGYAAGVGSNIIYVVPSTSTQLSVTAQVQNNQPTGGSSNVIFGSAFQCCRAAIAGVTIRLADTIGSRFSTESAQTDGNGFYSVSFTLGQVSRPLYDFITVTASGNGLTGSKSTICLNVSQDDSSHLVVTLNRFLPAVVSSVQNHPFITSAPNNYMVVEAEVVAGGLPVANASVTFADTPLGSTFTPLTATTNSSGRAITQLYLSSGGDGIDTITAVATLPDHLDGIGSNIIFVASPVDTQLSVTVSVENSNPAGGSRDSITGYAFQCCRRAVPQVTVAVTDTIGSHFHLAPTLTDYNGYYQVNFTLGSVKTSTYDVVTVTATAAGYSSSSSSVFFVVGTTGPSTAGWNVSTPPVNLGVRGSVGSTLLTWDPPADSGAPSNFTGAGIELYDIYRGTSAGGETFYYQVGGSTLSYTDSSVSPGVIYFYEITAENPAGQSPYSNEASGHSVIVTAPSVVQNLTLGIQGKAIILSWQAPTDDGGSPVTAYLITRGPSPDSLTDYQLVAANSRSYLDTEVNPGQIYYYTVSARNSYGRGNPTDPVNQRAPLNAPGKVWYESPVIQSIAQIASIFGAAAGVIALLLRARARPSPAA